MRRRTRWLVILLTFVAVLIVAAYVGWTFALPAFLRGEIFLIFARAGFNDVTFKLQPLGLWQTAVDDIAAGDGQFQIGRVTVSYRPLEVIRGRADAVVIRDAQFTLNLDRLPQTPRNSGGEPSSGELPVRSIELESSVLIIEQAARVLRLPLSGSLRQTTPAGPWQVDIAAKLNDAPLTLAGTITPPSYAADLVVSAQGADLQPVVAMITQGRANAGGTFFGRVPLKLDGGQITIGQGFFATAGTGTLQLAAVSSTIAQVLDQSDPRFARDPQMTQVKRGILEALGDFQYDHLRADLTRRDGKFIASVRIQGRGRTGTRQPLDITLNLRGLEDGLNTYLATRSRVMNIGK